MAHYGALTIVFVVALGCTAGAVALFRGSASEWPDVTGSENTLQNTAIGLTITALLHWSAGAALILNQSHASEFTAVVLLIFVIGGFAGNLALFGDWRPKHTVTNTIIAALGWLLLWLGESAT